MTVVFDMQKIKPVEHLPAGWMAFDQVERTIRDGQVAAMRAVFHHLRPKWHYISDPVKHAVRDFWEINPSQTYRNRAGDCEEFMIACRHGCLMEGLPPEALYFASGFTETGLRHGVLQLNIDPGPYTFDQR